MYVKLESFFSTSVTLTYTKLGSFITIYILKDFTEGFVHISFTLIYTTLYRCTHGKSTYISEGSEFSPLQ